MTPSASSLRFRLTAGAALLASLTANLLAASSPPVTDIGSRRELFVDSALVERLSGGAQLRLHRPIPREMALEHDLPWEGTGCVYHCVFRDGNLFRMYYRGYNVNPAYESNKAGKVTHKLALYAESDDGIRWRKPELGLHAFEGSKANNIVLVNGALDGVEIDPSEMAIFKDENPAAPPDARYKALILTRRAPPPPGVGATPERPQGPTAAHNRRGLVALKSADGLRWTPLVKHPVITDGAFDSQNLAFWDAERGVYRAYWRYFDRGTPDQPYVGIRSIRTATSKDFIHWENQQDLVFPDAPRTHLYTNAVKPYHRAPHLLIGLPVRYLERELNDGLGEARTKATPEQLRQWSASLRALPDLEQRERRATGGSERYGSAITETVLMASRDGVTFKRWDEAFLPPGIEREGTWNYGHQYTAWHVIETKSDLPGAPDELSFFATESYWTPPGSALRRYTLRLDGFVSAEAPMSGGELLTTPIQFQGNVLALNFATSAAGSIRVEIQDLDGKPLPGFALADCPPHFGDTIERVVTWRGGSDVGALAGRAVRLRFVLQDADLYAYQFSPRAK
jgi:hypothetical protein